MEQMDMGKQMMDFFKTGLAGNTMGKQMMDFYKNSFEQTFNAMAMLQDQMVTLFTQQTAALPEQSKKPINDWVQAIKTGREQFKKAVDENFKKVEEFFNKTAG
jgi:gas vesicle protein